MPDRIFSEANEDQRKFWSDGPGLTWVALRDELDTLHSRVADVMLAAAAPRAGQTIIDIGCGSGATTLWLAKAARPGGAVTGLDVSDSLLASARQRAEALGADAPKFVLADAQVWTPDEPVDLCTSRMGVMFFADPAAAFANILTMLRPGGRLVFICWRAQGENPWFDLPMRAAVARLGAAESGDPDGPGPMSLRDPARIRDLLERAGFSEINVTATDTSLWVPGGCASAAKLATRIGPAMRHMRDKQATEADASAIRSALEAGLRQFDTPTGAVIPARMNLVKARRP